MIRSFHLPRGRRLRREHQRDAECPWYIQVHRAGKKVLRDYTKALAAGRQGSRRIAEIARFRFDRNHVSPAEEAGPRRDMSTELTEHTVPSMSLYTTAVSVVADSAPDSEASSKRRAIYCALLIFMAALAVRVLFFSIQSMHFPAAWSRTAPFWHDEMGDIAVNLAYGRGYSSPFGPGTTPTAWLCPLIPFLWALIIRCVGGATGHTALIIAYVGTIPSACCAVVYWLIARHILRGRPQMQRASLLVAAFFCFWPDALYRLDYPWYFAWQELATAAMVLLGMKWIDRPSLKSVMPLGVVAGILALINVTPMPVFPVLLLLPMLQNREAWKRTLSYASAGAFLALLITLPWIVRNALALHAFVPLRSNAGYQLWEGNNPDGCIRETGTSRHPINQVEELQRYRRLGEAGYNRQGFHDAIFYMRFHPAQTAIRIGQRAYVMWLTDTLDQWSWNGTPYWKQGPSAVDRAMASTVPAWTLVILMIWAFLSKRLTALPYKWVFISLLFFLPFPYYFTLAEDDYSQILRSWLLLLVILAFSGALASPGQRQNLRGES